MRPPNDRRLDFNGTGTDQPVSAPPKPYGVGWSLTFLVATVLVALSSTLAWQLTLSLGKNASPRGLIILNGAYWYVWALFTPAIVWVSQRYRFERQKLRRAVAVHLPCVGLFSLGHIAAMGLVHWWLATSVGRQFQYWPEVQRSALQYFDWEMVTYWAIVGLSHAVHYYRESRDRALRASQLETRLVEAQLDTLQQQLHPHFLFNTLHAVSALMHRDVEAADRMLTGLSDLLRLTLEHMGLHGIPLKAELDFVSRYVQIERMRFADRLTVRFDIAPEALDCLVPTMVLQPLVENAIKHGVSRKAGRGHIDISARREGDKLLLEVRDDGVGLSQDALTVLQKGIGVSTTRARLQYLFGADFRFEFHRRPVGLAVLVAVPWRSGVPDSTKDTEAATRYGQPVAAAAPAMRTTTAPARQHS